MIKPTTKAYPSSTETNTEDNSPVIGEIILTVTRKESIPIKASVNGMATFGEMLDASIISTYHNIEKDGFGLINKFEIEFNEETAHSLRERILRGEYGKKKNY